MCLCSTRGTSRLELTMMNNKISVIGLIVLAIVLQATASAQTRQQPITANLCEVVTSPNKYNGKVLSVEGILLRGEHSVLLYSLSCRPKAGFDVRIDAVFPEEWASSPNGKRLHKLLFSHRSTANVKLIGTFESRTGPYGPDVAPFRFTIREISSVKKARDPSAPRERHVAR